jgi:hypothetical protein
MHANAEPCGRQELHFRKTRPESKAKASQCPHLHALIGHAKNQDGAPTCLARESLQNPTDGQDPQKVGTPRSTLLAASDILTAARGQVLIGLFSLEIS